MDIVRRRLELIDSQRLWRTDFHNQLIGSCPLIFAAAGLIAGIIFQNIFTAPIFFYLAILAVCLTAAAVLFLNRRSSDITVKLLAYLAMVSFACLGAVRLAYFYQPAADDIRELVGQQRRLATIRGFIATEPYTSKGEQWYFAQFNRTDPKSTFYLSLNSIQAVDGWARAAGTVKVRVDEPVIDLKEGDLVQIYCWLDRFAPPRNPGQFDTQQYMARKNIYVSASVMSRDGIEVLAGDAAGWAARICRKLKEKVIQALREGDISAQDDTAGLLEGLLLGYRTQIDPETYRAFCETGLLHFVSLSGMNFAIMIGIVWWLCGIAGLNKPARAVVCMVTAVLFLLVVPPKAPATRAAIICFIFCASIFFRRRSNAVNALSLAAVVLLLIKPTDVFEVDWQLSFAAILGIILLSRRMNFFFHERLYSPLGNKQAQDTGLALRSYLYIGGLFSEAFSVGIAAGLSTAGILLYHFYTVNFLSVLWTVAVSPLIAVISVLGYVNIVLALFLPTAAAVLGLAVGWFCSVLVWVVQVIAGWNISRIPVGKTPDAVIIFYYAIVFFIAFAYFRRPVVKKTISIAAVTALAVFFLAADWNRTHRDELTIDCLDVGHGQAILARLPGDSNILFDAGSLYTANIGRRIVVPFLNYIGTDRLDAIIISHDDIDHINGIPEIVEDCKVSGIFADRSFLSEANSQPAGRFLVNWLASRGTKIDRTEQGLDLDSPAKISFIWPPAELPEDEKFSDNDSSVVSLVEFIASGVLFCSDIEKAAQNRLLQLCPDLKPKAVIVPHHGSPRTQDKDFLSRLGAELYIYSCNRSQYERCQSNAVKDSDGVRSFFTARDGFISFSIDKSGAIKLPVSD